MQKKVSHCFVIGLGGWGTALSVHLATCGHQVTAWARNGAFVEQIRKDGENKKHLPGVALPESLNLTTDLADISQCEALVFATPASSLLEITSRISCHFEKIRSSLIVVSAIKGLTPEAHKTPLQFLSEQFSMITEFVVLSGPSFAHDVARGLPVGVVAGSSSQSAAKKIAELFSSPSMKVYTSSDPLGVELGGIVKNVIALAAGVGDGVGLGDSARASVITRGLAEMMRLFHAMGADEKTLFGLSGIGDLAMTASSDKSRNRMVGLRLGRGEKLSDIVTTLGSVAEGVTTTPRVLELAKTVGVEMPITEAVSLLLEGNVRPLEVVTKLMTRPSKAEF